MKIYRVVMCVLLILVSSAVLGQQDGDPLDFTETYDENGIRFDYPAGWIVAEGDFGQVTLANSPSVVDAIGSNGYGVTVAGDIAVLIVALPDFDDFTALEAYELASFASVDGSGLDVDAPVERELGDFLTLTGNLRSLGVDGEPDGIGALYTLDYSPDTVMIALGIGLTEDVTLIEVVIEKLVKSLEIDESMIQLD